MFNIQWTASEKKLARKVFDAALEREMTALLATFKEKAAAIKSPDEIWEIANYLTNKEREIVRKYDYRYSQLILVFAILLREKWITLDELQGLSDEKREQIHHLAGLR